MNEIDAVSPRFFYDLRDLEDLFGEFGPYNGRYISKYPNDWIEKLRGHLNELEADLRPVEMARANQLIAKYKDSLLLDSSYSFDDKCSWTDNVENLQKTKHPFNDVIADIYESNNDAQTWREKSFLYKDNRSRNMHLKGTIGEYISVIKPLLKKGPAAYLIDPYFCPSNERSVAFLSRLFEEIAHSSCYKIILYIKKSEALVRNNDHKSSKKTFWTLKEYESELENSLARFIKSGKSLVVNLVEERSRNSDERDKLFLHARYFLTKYGAINLDKGFSLENNSTPQLLASIVDKQPHLELVDWYINEKASFLAVDRIEIKG